ncbi:MAG: STAS domain-containing protein [Magnetococcus sp. YQC-3]
MPSTVFSSLSGQKTTICVNGRFNFELFSRFRTACLMEGLEGKGVRHIVIDLSGTECIDSSGMDILLFMRDEMGTRMASMEMINARPELRHALEVACFHRLFKIT